MKILLFFSLLSVSAAAADWASLARDLTGHSEAVRQTTIVKLKRTPGLKSALKKALRTERKPLALDVISALSLQALLPSLVRELARDEDGSVHLAINSLLTSENGGEIASLYRERMSSGAYSVPAGVVMLDTLGRLGVEIPQAELGAIYKGADVELRSAALYYARRRLGAYYPILDLALSDRHYQLRLQALYAMAELFHTTVIPELVMGLGCRNAAKTIVVAFGYKDARPARFVGDRYEAIALRRKFLAECPGGVPGACGFRQDPDDAELLTKDGVDLRIAYSSVGPDDDDNRENGFQVWQSRRARHAFLDGLKTADAVFYDGHSRDGGGPSFGPPHLTAAKGVDYHWYVTRRIGIKDVLQALGGPSRVKELGIYSCRSTTHFSREIHAKKKELALDTSTKLVYYADALSGLVRAISRLLR